MELPRKDGYMPGGFVLIYNTFAYIMADLQFDDLNREQVGVKVWATNNSYEFVDRLGTGKVLQQRGRYGQGQSY